VKFRCERDTLAEAFSAAGRATGGRTGAHPVLAGILLELEDDRLTVTGTDLDLTIRIQLTVGGETNGVVVLPAKLAADIVRSLGDGAVTVDASSDPAGDAVHITGGRSQFVVRPLAADDFPRLPAPSESAVSIPTDVLSESLRQVVRAASTDDSRPVLTGVLLSAEADGLRLVATDSYRLAVRDIPGESVLAADQRVLVPGRALGELQRLLSSSEKVTLRLGERDATFDTELGSGSLRLSTRLIEGEFPNYGGLIPQHQPNRITVAREPLLEAIRRVKIFARDTTPLRLHLGNDHILLSAVSQELGTANEEIDARLEGTEMTVSFNADYLSSGIEAIGTDEITLETSEALRPAVLRGVGAPDYLYLLMPVRVPT
jgi:DNA polymerase III subunit beta